MFFSVLLALVLTGPAPAPEGSLWVSWDTFEPDSCAAAWLIKRHVDPKARFQFLPRGSRITQGIPFDTPEARFRRYPNLSTYESILAHYKVSHPAAVELGKIIRDIEINKWARKSTAHSREVEDRIRKLVAESKTPQEILERSFAFFDALAQSLVPPGAAPWTRPRACYGGIVTRTTKARPPAPTASSRWFLPARGVS